MSAELIRALYTVLLGIGGGGGLFLLLTYGPQRRKINAGASSDEASAASVLSGAALDMVREAREEAAGAKAEAVEARKETAAVRRELGAAHDEIQDLKRHVDRLVRLIQAAGIDLPASLDPRRGGRLEGETK